VDHQTSQDTGRPYSEITEEGYVIREFSSSTSSFELVWHRDKEDRYVQAIGETDWEFQLDNQIPQVLSENKLFIPKETYHRLIKGTGDLTVKVYKLWNVTVKYVAAENLVTVNAATVRHETNEDYS